MRYKDENSNLESHITTLRVVISLLVVLTAYMWYGWKNASSAIRIHIPPDLRSGAVVHADEVHDANVYGFANYVFQQLNHWPENGKEDYGQQIFNMRYLITPEFSEYLTKDMNKRNSDGELAHRVRFIQPIQGKGYEKRRVDLLNENNWIVWLDYGIHEYVKGMAVKTVYIRYPLRVTRFNVDKDKNSWGLALNGFGGKGPRKLSEEEMAEDSPEITK